MSLKAGANISDQIQIQEMYISGESPEAISDFLGIEIEVIKRFKPKKPKVKKSKIKKDSIVPDNNQDQEELL